MRAYISAAMTSLIGLAGLCIFAAANAQDPDVEFDYATVGLSPEQICRQRVFGGRVITAALEKQYAACVEAERERVRAEAQATRQADAKELARRRRPSEPDSDCSVQFQHLTKYAYSTSTADYTAIRLTGTYRMGKNAGKFSIIDDDGLVTMAALASRWQSLGQLNGNTDTGTRIARADFELMAEAGDMGGRYYRNLSKSFAARKQGESEDQYATRQRSFTERWNYLDKVSTYAKSKMSSAPQSAEIWLLMSDLGHSVVTFLERFNNPQEKARYVDIERPNQFFYLCNAGKADPGMSNIVVGSLLCNREFLLHTRRDERVCAKGVLFSPFPKLCDTTAGKTCAFGGPKAQ